MKKKILLKFNILRLVFGFLFLIIFQLNCISVSWLGIGKQEELPNTFEPQNDSVKVKNLLSEGNDLFYKNLYEKALTKFSEANSIKPTEDGYYLMGLSLIKTENLPGAKDSFTKGLELNSSNEKILSSYALVLNLLGELENSRQVYAALVKKHPANNNYLFKYGVVLKSLGNFEDAFSILKKVKEDSFSQKLQLFLNLGSVSSQLKKYLLADEYFTKAKLLDPNLNEIDELKSKNEFHWNMEKGNDFLLSKNYTDAIKSYQSALKFELELQTVYSKLARANFFKEDYIESEKYFRKVLLMNENDKDAYIHLASISEKNTGSREAISILNSAAEKFPNDSLLYTLIGNTYARAGNKKMALLSYITAKQKDYRNLESRKLLSQTLTEEGFILEANRELSELIDLYPKDDQIRKTLSKINRNQVIKNSKKTKGKLKIEEVNSNFSLAKTNLIEKADKFLEQKKTEKCLEFLKSAWDNNKKQNQIEILELIATYYAKLGYSELARESFLFILEKNPESYVSYYQLGLLSLPSDRLSALLNFDRAIILNRNYSIAYIARGITFYKLGKRENARDDFQYALSLESNNEIASYNLGMILYNDHLYKDAEEIFLDLTKKYPKFADPFYHLGYIYYEQKKMDEAEKYIGISLKLDRNPGTLFAYIKILEGIKKHDPKRKGLDSSLYELRKELVEKYPNSSYSGKLLSSGLGNEKPAILVQKYSLVDTIVSPPIFVNKSMLINYGNSIVRIHSDSKEIIWRLETKDVYKSLKIGTRLYAISNKQINQIDLETGKKIWEIRVDSDLTGKLELGDIILFSGMKNGSEIIYSYSFEGDFISDLKLESGSKWDVNKKGEVFIFRNIVDGMSWEIFDSALNILVPGQTLLGSEAGEMHSIGATDTDCFIRKGKQVYRFAANGKFFRSPKIEKEITNLYIEMASLYLDSGKNTYLFSDNLANLKQLDILENSGNKVLIPDQIYSTKEEVFTIRDKSGKVIWTIKDNESIHKSKSSVFSILLN